MYIIKDIGLEKKEKQFKKKRGCVIVKESHYQSKGKTCIFMEMELSKSVNEDWCIIKTNKRRTAMRIFILTALVVLSTSFIGCEKTEKPEVKKEEVKAVKVDKADKTETKVKEEAKPEKKAE